MKIKKEQLLDLLATKTDLPPEQVKTHLDELITEIQQAVAKDKSFDIEGFGIFTMEEDTLRFNAAPNLETEINHKYAGMEPIELIGAFKDTPDVEIPKEQYLDKPQKAEKESPEPVSDSTEDSSAQEPVKERSSRFAFDAESTEKEQLPQKPAKKQKPKPTQKTKKEAVKSEDPIGRILVVAVIVIAIGVSGWFAYDLGLFDRFLGAQKQVQDPTEEVGAATQSPGPQKDEPTVEQKQQNDVSKSAGIAEQSKQSSYGLRGGAVPEVAGGYTIVVHSLRSEERARGLKRNLSRDGYLTILKSAVVNGKTYWRVGLGQFRNLEDAKQAVRSLPKQYRENNFIRKF